MGALVKFRDADTTTATISRKTPTTQKNCPYHVSFFPLAPHLSRIRGGLMPIGRAYELPPGTKCAIVNEEYGGRRQMQAIAESGRNLRTTSWSLYF